LNVSLNASDIITSEKLVEFGKILLGRSVALGNSTTFIKKIIEIKWWHVVTHEFILHIFSSLNQRLKSGFLVSFHIYPLLAHLSSQFRDSEADFLHKRALGEVLIHAMYSI